MSTQVLVFSLLVIVAAVGWALQVGKHRRRGMRRLAAELRATFHAADRDHLERRFADLAMWQYGHTHRVSDVCAGTEGPIEYVCFTDSFDVGFGRERVRRTHMTMVAVTQPRRPEAVCIRQGHFWPCGPHAHYELAPGEKLAGEDSSRATGWQVWCRPGEDAGPIRERLGPLCERLSGPCLVEIRGDLVVVCCPGQSEPGEYRRMIEVGLELARSLRA